MDTPLTYLYAPSDNNSFRKYLNEKLSTHDNIFILLDENTKKFCKKKLVNSFPELEKAKEILIRSGEKNKNLETCNLIWEKLLKNNADRHSLLINLGGGVITDMGSFAASVYKRGISFCNIPTTLLGMIDAAIGGKTGVDFNGLKNIIGNFVFAEKTYIDNEFLKTLPENHLRSGFAELLKIAVISDKSLWGKLLPLNYNDIVDQPDLIKRAVVLKNKIVLKDPFERGLRKKLNFGHTVGHAIESYSLINDNKPLLHGEAVAIGMICETWISSKICGLPDNEMNEIIGKITSVFGKQKLKFDKRDLLKIMMNDKKNISLKKDFTILTNIGEACIENYFNDELIFEAIDYYCSL